MTTPQDPNPQDLNPQDPNPQDVLEHLKQLEQGNTVQSARYREEAQEVLADDSVSLKWRKAIADRLNQANHDLALHTAGSEDSY